jgi:enoyl-CoA hydratase/carnithine racemase
MWIALKLLASGAFEAAMKGLSAAWQWIISDWRNGPLLWFGVLFLVNAFIVNPAHQRRISGLEADLAAEQAAHLGTVNAFLAASEQAQKDAQDNAQRVAREQEIITDEIVSDYRSDLAALRSRFDRLRAGTPRTDPGGAHAAGVPGLPDAAGRVDAATGEDRLPAAGSLTLPDALIASEQALQLDALIDWIEAQSAVRFTPEGSR